MRKINQTQYKKDVISVLKKHGTMWLSDLSRKYGLPHVSLHCENHKHRPASKALKNLIDLGRVIVLKPRYYKTNSSKPRVKLSLPIKSNPRRYFELELIKEIEKLKQEISELKKPWYKKLFN